jgi:hypothetical protein
MYSVRLRSRIGDAELDAKVGRIVTDADANVLLTGPTQVLMPSGKPLCVYLPGVLREAVDAPGVYDVLHSLKGHVTDNRVYASGSPRYTDPKGQRRSARKVPSAVVGAVDASGRHRWCRLTAWTGQHLPQWQTLAPVLRAVADRLEEAVPDRYAAQAAEAARTRPEWVVPGTPFTTITVNNSYATGVHTDKGDLDAGFSTIACLRRGTYTGGRLVFPRWRVAVDMAHGDLLCMDAHEWHGNTALVCACGEDMTGPCQACGAERISVVAYFRTNMTQCGTAEDEVRRAQDRADRRGAPTGTDT